MKSRVSTKKHRNNHITHRVSYHKRTPDDHAHSVSEISEEPKMWCRGKFSILHARLRIYHVLAIIT